MSIEAKINDFIRHFDGSQDVFLHGCCYWFAWILLWRFREELTKALWVDYILYEPAEGHFIYGVCDCALMDGKTDNGFHYYDVRGDVTNQYKGKELYTIRYMMDKMPDYYAHLMRDCRDFIQPDDE